MSVFKEIRRKDLIWNDDVIVLMTSQHENVAYLRYFVLKTVLKPIRNIDLFFYKTKQIIKMFSNRNQCSVTPDFAPPPPPPKKGFFY